MHEEIQIVEGGYVYGNTNKMQMWKFIDGLRKGRNFYFQLRLRKTYVSVIMESLYGMLPGPLTLTHQLYSQYG